MLRPLPLVAVRQQANEARHAQPFALTRRDKLVENDLRAVGKVAELRFPQGQGTRLCGGIAIFEAEHGFFREARIEHLEARLWITEMVERRVAFLAILIEKHGMPLRESASFGVL